MPTVHYGYGPNRKDWDETDPQLAASVAAEVIVRLNEDARQPVAVMACAMCADTLLASIEALHLDTTDAVIFRRGLVRDLVDRLSGRAHLVYLEDCDDPEWLVAQRERDGDRSYDLWKENR